MRLEKHYIIASPEYAEHLEERNIENSSSLFEDITSFIAVGTAVSACLLKLNGKRLEKWKDDTYFEWSAVNRVFDEIEDFGLDNERLSAALHVLSALVRKFYNSPTKSSAKKQLDDIMVFMELLTSSETYSDTKDIIYRYYSKYKEV